MNKKDWERISTKREAKRNRMAAKATVPNLSFVLVDVDAYKKIPKLTPEQSTCGYTRFEFWSRRHFLRSIATV